MEPVDIARIKATHKPRPWWRACRVTTGCTCGAKRWPCDALLVARDAESRANQPNVEARVRVIINRKYGRYPS
ncbi:hypothetical protein GCM10009835_46580 [Planosporangium flavigriseum]|uniref:Uncharacterized protein n=1 Tax=Planosporangium flavigriseum TaxID=373681 RepID=A0A8J3PJ10_9ACTN|nr:hypothetical protein Pfl04_02100 [Planosporangium flavigriseum]